MKYAVLILALLTLSGCGGCLNPWTKLSDCPAGLPGHHSR